MTIAPTTRREILATMARTAAGFYDELCKGFHEDPKCSEAKQLVLEAAALGMLMYAKKHPDAVAIVQTLVIELQEQINEARNSK